MENSTNGVHSGKNKSPMLVPLVLILLAVIVSVLQYGSSMENANLSAGARASQVSDTVMVSGSDKNNFGSINKIIPSQITPVNKNLSVWIDFTNPPPNINDLYMPNDVLVKINPHMSYLGTPVYVDLYAGMTGTGQGLGTQIATSNSFQLTSDGVVFPFSMEDCSQLYASSPFNNRFNAVVYFSSGQGVQTSSVPVGCQVLP